MAGIEELLARPLRTRSVTLAWDPNEAEALNEAKAKVAMLERQAKRNADSVRSEDLLDAEAAVENMLADFQTVTFHFESIGTKRQDYLIDKYPPSKEQQSKHKASGESGVLQYDPVRYPKALIAATCTKIVLPSGDEIDEIDEDDMTSLFNSASFSQSDQVELFQAAMMVDLSKSSVEDVGKD